MTKPVRKVTLDYETRSRCDLGAAGAYKYAQDTSTEILCLGYKIDDEPAALWLPFEPLPNRLFEALKNQDVTLHAHNAFFEQCITRFVLPQYIESHGQYLTLMTPIKRWRCTAAKAAAHALPRKLGEAGRVLGLKVQKDNEGHRLMLKYCKPRRATKSNADEWHSNPDELERLYQYCLTDVEAEYALDNALPDLSPSEQELWCIDQEINAFGFYVDAPLIKTVIGLAEQEKARLVERLQTITKGKVENADKRDKLFRWARAHGAMELENLQKGTIDAALKSKWCQEPAREVLKIRQLASKTSVAKYQAFIDRAGDDSRVRDILMFHGANTGRWSGVGVQPQNFPKGKIKDTETAIEAIKENDLNWLLALYDSPMEVFSSCIRGMIRAPEGKELFCADFAAIEARVLFWIANHADGIEAFETGRDLYKEMAAVIYDTRADKISKESNERQLGKQAILGAGYGMGWAKFLVTCKGYGIEVDELLAKKAIQAYRATHAPVVKLWSNLDLAAQAAVKNPSRAFTVNRCKWFMRGKFLQCQLPSGRVLSYYGPRLKVAKTPWGDDRLALHYWYVDGLTKQWVMGSTYGGALTENVVQAASRDLMAYAMRNVREAGYKIIMTVHDELVAERKAGTGSVEEFVKLMTQLPDWAKGCPVGAEGWKGQRYKK